MGCGCGKKKSRPKSTVTRGTMRKSVTQHIPKEAKNK